MVVKTIETYVDVDVDLNDFDDDELIEELGSRGFTVVEDLKTSAHLDDADLEFLIAMLDKQEFHWYNARIRDKLFNLRYQGKY